MQKISQEELISMASKSGAEAHSKDMKHLGIVLGTMLVNAHAHGFFMAVRYLESGQSTKKWAFWRRPPTVRELAKEASNQYIKKTFPSISPEDERAVRASLSAGFEKGYEHRQTRCDP